MKKILKLAMFLAVSLSFHSCVTSQNMNGAVYNDGQPAAEVSYQTFYDELSPYGSWIDYPGYGYVWSPSIQNFRPYYDNGYWSNTNLGWTWNSQYNWGWAPFHYGRWFYETGYGWLWLPGYEWAPAWVMWRNNNDYYGWAPLAPGMRLGTTIGFDIPFDHWFFVDHRFLNDRDFRNHSLDWRQNENVFRNSTIIGGTNYTRDRSGYYRGPDAKDLRRYTGQRINPLIVRDRDRQEDRQHQNVPAPVGNNDNRRQQGQVNVYRPQVRMPQNQEVVKPKQVVQYKDIPHDNGRRGTWGTPDQHPTQRNNNNNNQNGNGNGDRRGG